MFFSRPAGHKFVNRGDFNVEDFSEADFTTDNDYHDLDLSGVIPSDTKLILVRVGIINTTINETLRFRQKGFTLAANYSMIVAQEADNMHDLDMWLTPDKDGVVEYRATAVGSWTNITFNIRGWFV